MLKHVKVTLKLKIKTFVKTTFFIFLITQNRRKPGEQYDDYTNKYRKRRITTEIERKRDKVQKQRRQIKYKINYPLHFPQC